MRRNIAIRGAVPLDLGSPLGRSSWTRSSLEESGGCHWREAGPGDPADPEGTPRASAPRFMQTGARTSK